MTELFNHMVETGFMPHGHCYFWEPFILWSHAISDSVIALAYLVIPLSLVRIVKKRDDFTYMWMLGLFAIFILGCGTTHVFDVINIWIPAYRLDALVRIITALASIGTAVLLVAITPKLILFPSAKKWKMMNEELRSLNETLEKKVYERTAELAQSSAQFEFLTDAIPQIVWTADENGQRDYYNKTWYTYTGLTFEQGKGDGWKNTIHPDDIILITDKWKKSVREGYHYEAEFRIRSGADQSYRWHLGRALPMKDENGKVIKWFGTTTDIHDQKLQQEELKRVNEELDNFVYAASHDLKAPISNLESLLELMYKKNQEKDSPLFDMMQKQVEKLKYIIYDLSDVSRIQREAVEDISLLNIEEMVEEFKISHRKPIQDTGAEIQTDFRLTQFYFSIRHIRSIIHNLLDNALKYSAADKKPVIKITTDQRENQLVLTVEDNGIGIKPEHRDKIFGMFTRFSRDKEGTGIGLYMVKRIVEKYGGNIEIESEVGQGTLFRIYLKEAPKA